MPFRYRGQDESFLKSASENMNAARPSLARPSYTGTEKNKLVTQYQLEQELQRNLNSLRSSNEREAAYTESALREAEENGTAFKTDEDGLLLTGDDGAEAASGR